MERGTFLCGRCEHRIAETVVRVVILDCAYDAADGSGSIR